MVYIRRDWLRTVFVCESNRLCTISSFRAILKYKCRDIKEVWWKWWNEIFRNFYISSDLYATLTNSKTTNWNCSKQNYPIFSQTFGNSRKIGDNLKMELLDEQRNVIQLWKATSKIFLNLIKVSTVSRSSQEKKKERKGKYLISRSSPNYKIQQINLQTIRYQTSFPVRNTRTRENKRFSTN